MYDGTDFCGWARQPDRRSVQGTLETAIATVLRMPSVSLVVAGRTDAGVHARGQVCHVDLPAKLAVSAAGEPLEALLKGRLSRLLPEDVRVPVVRAVPADFDARFSALSRRYAYRICEDPASLDPLRRHDVLPWPRTLDLGAVGDASSRLLGEHDFASFCRRRAEASTVRALVDLSWTRSGGVVEARVVADAFCHQMVRSLVGALILVGEHRRPVGWPADLLEARSRDPRSPVVDARGLTLEEVTYPPDEELAVRSARTRARRT